MDEKAEKQMALNGPQEWSNCSPNNRNGLLPSTHTQTRGARGGCPVSDTVLFNGCLAVAPHLRNVSLLLSGVLLGMWKELGL